MKQEEATAVYSRCQPELQCTEFLLDGGRRGRENVKTLPVVFL